MTQKLLLVLFFIGLLFSHHTFSQESDSLLALKYFEKAEYFKGGKFITESPQQKIDSCYKYMKLAFPLLEKSKSWNKYVSAAKKIAQYEYKMNNVNAIQFLESTIDTLKKYNYKEYGLIYITISLLVENESHERYVNYLERAIEDNLITKFKISALNLLGKYYLKERNFDKSHYYYETRLKYLIKKNRASAYKNLSTLYSVQGKYELALNYIDSAIISSDDISSKARFISDKGAIYSNIGNFEKALEYCEQSLKEQLALKNINFRQLAKNYSNIGTMFYAKGDFIKSNEYLDQCISLLQENAANPKELLTPFSIKLLNNIELENYADAFKYAKLYKNILKYHQLDSSYVFNLYGRIYYNRGEYDSSLYYFQLSEKAGLDIINLNYIGDLFFKLGNYEKSRLYYSRFKNGIVQDSAKSKHPLVISANKFIGDTYFNEGKYDSALIYYNLVLQLAGIDKISSSEQEQLNNVLQKDLTYIIFDAFWSLSNTYIKLNSFHDNPEYLLKSHNYLLGASELLNNYKYYFESVNSKLFWTEKTSHFYDDVIRSSMLLWNKYRDKKYLVDTFRMIELSKVHVLKGTINESSAIAKSGIPDSLIEIENNYSKRLSSLRFSKRTELQEKNPNKVRLDYFDTEIFNIQRDYSFLIESFEKDYPAYHRIKYEINTINLENLKEKLSPDQSVLQYYLGKDELHLLIINKDSVYSISSDADSIFFNEIESFTSLLRKGNLLRNKQKSEFISNSFSLYKKLLLPAAEHLREKKELIIIPSGELLSVPFELLIKEPSSDLSFTKLQYIIKDFIISYEYSATLGFDPKYTNHTSDNDCFIGFAPSFKTTGVSNLNQRLPELLYNEEEVNQISELFRSNNREAEVYSGNKATEENFKKIKNCRYIHIATHSEADKNNPDLSALYFSGPLADTLSDNILYSDEIFDLKISADLVVLSSCETGAGRLINGEGVLSLTRGFIYKGVPNLLFSLWKVSDRSTKSLMVEFYKNVIEGKNYKTALRESKLKMLTHEVTSFPDKWGAFILMSN